MNYELQKPQHLISLASSAVLVSVDTNVWSATKQDKVISEEVTISKNADKSAGRYVKNLLANHPKHKAIVNYRQTIYNWLQRRTYGWNQSQSLLPSVDVPKFKQEFGLHEVEFHALVDSLINDYDSIVSDMAFKQGSMFNRDDYPSKEHVRSKFDLKLYVSEVPMNDFRCNIAQDIADDLFTSLNAQTMEIITSIQTEQSERLVEVMKSISHCCGHDETGSVDMNGEVVTKKRKIYESTIQKAREYIETFKQFNPNNDSLLEEARASLETVLKDVTSKDIRDSDALRHSVKEGVDDILGKFSSFQCFN